MNIKTTVKFNKWRNYFLIKIIKVHIGNATNNYHSASQIGYENMR